MGLSSSNITAALLSRKEQIIIPMMGLFGSGKTSILYRLKSAELVHSISTIGFNVEDVEHKNICFRIYDIRESKMIPVWCKTLEGSRGLIFVVDSTNKKELQEAQNLLNSMLTSGRFESAALLVYANKQDLPDALSAAEIADALKLYDLKDRVWYVQPASAVQDEGLYKGLNWMSNVVTIPK